MKESDFQALVINELRELYPDCIIMKNDPNYNQGIPDWTILIDDFWGTLEIKGSRDSRVQRNQEYYVTKMNSMSFSAFIYPENKERVFNELQKACRARRPRVFRG